MTNTLIFTIYITLILKNQDFKLSQLMVVENDNSNIVSKLDLQGSNKSTNSL